MRRDDGYEIDTDPERLDLDRIHHWLSTDAYWARGRSADVVARSVQGSTNFGLYRPDGAPAGFARVVTDGATFAWLCDVYVDPARRGAGIGKELLAAVLAELSPLKLTRVMLATADAHALYAAHGFEPLPDPSMLMVQRRPKG